MGVALEKFTEQFTAEERGEIEAHAETLIAEEMSLRDPRRALGKTQAFNQRTVDITPGER